MYVTSVRYTAPTVIIHTYGWLEIRKHINIFVRLLSTAMVRPTAVRSVRVKGSSACTNNDPINDVTEQHGDQQEPCLTRHNYDGGRAPYFSQQEIKILLDLVEIRLPSSSRNWAEIAWALYMLYPNNKVMRCGDACHRKFLNLCNTRQVSHMNYVVVIEWFSTEFYV
jgi:hypothetical protein